MTECRLLDIHSLHARDGGRNLADVSSLTFTLIMNSRKGGCIRCAINSRSSFGPHKRRRSTSVRRRIPNDVSHRTFERSTPECTLTLEPDMYSMKFAFLLTLHVSQHIVRRLNMSFEPGLQCWRCRTWMQERLSPKNTRLNSRRWKGVSA